MGVLSRTIRSLVAGAALSGCTDDIGVNLALVDGTRLLAVVGSPLEAEPGASVELTALVVDENGERSGDTLEWFLCTARRSLDEPMPISSACLAPRSSAREGLGTGASVTAEVPADACRRFGPDPPHAEPGEPHARPVEPDRTGGFYQPIVVDAGGETGVYGLRLRCGVAGATQAQAAELRARYIDNVAPVVEVLAAEDPGSERVVVDGDVTRVSPGTDVRIRVQWAQCPEHPTCGDASCTLDEDPEACPDDCSAGAGCPGAEWYVRFDPVALEVTSARESISLSWYATTGGWDVARTGRSETDPARSSENTWTAPDTPGPATLWIVVRDDRGGIAWRQLHVRVEP